MKFRLVDKTLFLNDQALSYPAEVMEAVDLGDLIEGVSVGAGRVEGLHELHGLGDAG